MRNKHFFKMLFVAAALLFSSSMYAQNIQVSGRVADAATNMVLPGATVQIFGTTNGTITDFDGNFTLNATTNDTLLVSFVGYISLKVAIGSQTNFDVRLNAKEEALEEVVVIGYGKVAKKDATGSVVAVGAKDFNKGAITSPQELMMGKTSGVVVTTASGEPGAGATIRIRGGSSLRASNSPLIVIDGLPVDEQGINGLSNPLSVINPNDIESITVLKDASAAAIYGSRASNGVIIITTKRGSAKGFSASYNGNISVGVPVKYMDVLTGDQFRAVLQDRIENYGLTSVASDNVGTENTDWQKEIYQNAISTDHNVSANGSIKDVPYRVSLGYTNQNGLLKNSNMERTTASVSASPSFFDKHLNVNVNLKAMDINNNFSNTDAIGSAIQFDPTQPIMNGNTRYGGYTAWTELSENDPLNGLPNNIATHNPVARLAYRDNTSDVMRSIGNVEFDYKFHFLPDLSAKLNMGYDYFTSDGNDITDTLASWSYREPARQVVGYTQTGKNSLVDFYLNYNKNLKSIRSKIDFTAGYSWQHFYREGSNSNRPVAMTNDVYVGADTTEYKYENYLVSFFGRLNYSLMDKYLFTATVRDDGSSRFADENRWGLFPSLAFAWKINNEAFLQDFSALTELKFRAGYGVTGQQNIFDNMYPYIPTYTISQQGAYYQFGNQFYPTLRPGAYDSNIKWEETTTKNIGLDFGFFNDRITGSVDVYNRVTDNLINEIPIAAGTNFSNFLVTNVGSLENKGYEFSLNAVPVSKTNLSWELGFTLSYNQNKITKLTLVDDPAYTGYETGGISGGVGNNVQINSVGYPASTFFLFNQVYGTDGLPIEGLYVDKTGEGGVVSANSSNKYYLGDPAPDYLMGISSKLVYKNFDFGFSGRISLGNYVYNNNASNRALYQNIYNQSGYLSNIPTSIYDTEFTTAQYWSDFYLEDASFFRMDNISIAYNFDNMIGEKVNGRVTFVVQNAFVITNYTGLDPEVSGGIDNNIYPRPRTYLLGFNLNF